MQSRDIIIIAKERCTGCGWCIASCTQRAIILDTTLPHGFGDKRARIDLSLCNRCQHCLSTCPHLAISVHTPR